MLKEYLKNKEGLIFYIWVSRIFILIFFYILGIEYYAIIISLLIFLTMDIFYFGFKSWKYREEKLKYNKLIKELDKHYYIHELIKRPIDEEKAIYYDLIKIANQDMINEINNKENEITEFREIIEEWIHEMKTPLTSIKLLNNDENISGEILRLENFLDLSLSTIRLDTLEKDYHVEDINFMDIFHSIILEEKELIRNKDLKINLNIENIYSIKSDGKWIKFILKQIIINSIKYSKNFGEIKVEEKYGENNYILDIVDYGTGIEESDLHRVFEKGFTGSGNKRESSSGLGLYLVKRCCDKMNIKISVKSKFNKYTKISLVFPME